MIFDRVANGIQRHAKAIVIIWVVILCISGYFAIKSPEVMSYDLNDMAPKDSESIKGMVILTTEFPSAIVDETVMPIVVLYYEDEESGMYLYMGSDNNIDADYDKGVFTDNYIVFQCFA